VDVHGRGAEGDQHTVTNTHPRNQSKTLYDTTATSGKWCCPTNPFIPAGDYNQPATDCVSMQTYRQLRHKGNGAGMALFGIATRYGMDGPRIESRPTGLRAYQASRTRGTGTFPWVKRPGRGVDQLPHLALRLKEVRSYRPNSTPRLGLHNLS